MDMQYLIISVDCEVRMTKTKLYKENNKNKIKIRFTHNIKHTTKLRYRTK